jgi:MoaA/NifB/PqqE/SkfB family radical SAM enzyme
MTISRWLREPEHLYKSVRFMGTCMSSRPFMCNWQITSRCNMHCGICSFWRAPHTRDEELDLAGVQLITDRLRPFAPLVISMAGGEPLLRRDLPEIASLLAKDHFFTLITNGWFLTRPLAERLYEAGTLDIHVSLESLDYADPDKHDGMRGCKGAFDRAVAALRLLREIRPDRHRRVHMMTVLMDDNVEELDGLLRLAEELDVTFELSLYSHRRGQKPVRYPHEEVAAHLLELKRRYPCFLSPARYLRSFDVATRTDGLPPCRGGDRFFNINHRGGVSRCIDTNDHEVGDARTTPLEDLLARLSDLQEAERCNQCWTSCRGFADVLKHPMSVVPLLPRFI